MSSEQDFWTDIFSGFGDLALGLDWSVDDDAKDSPISPTQISLARV
jgi:hypothetical protein